MRNSIVELTQGMGGGGAGGVILSKNAPVASAASCIIIRSSATLMIALNANCFMALGGPTYSSSVTGPRVAHSHTLGIGGGLGPSPQLSIFHLVSKSKRPP